MQNLESKIKNHLRERPSINSLLEELESLRLTFVQAFPQKKIKNLSLDEYVQGKGSRDSFCYWIEHGLERLGDCHGGTAEKFGVYFSKEDGDYRFTQKFGSNLDQAFHTVRDSINDLLIAGEKRDLNGIIANRFSNMLKGKILGTYFPEKYLNIYDAKHLDYFLIQLNIDPPNIKNLNEVHKRELLMDLKRQHPVMENWSMQEYVTFLYWQFGNPRDYTSQNLVDDETVEEIIVFPPNSEVKPEFIELNLLASALPNSEKEKKFHGKTDFEAQLKRNKEVGDRGERYVFEMEKRFLIENENEKLADEIEHISLNNDGAGYDIESRELDGSRKFIEVKSTVAKPSIVNFLLTANELNQAKNLPNYYIYVVFEVNSLKPKIWRWKNPFKVQEQEKLLFPILYHVVIKP